MMRLWVSISMAWLNPRPLSPNRLFELTGVSWKTISSVVELRIPNFPCIGLMVSPGESFCTRKALIPL